MNNPPSYDESVKQPGVYPQNVGAGLPYPNSGAPYPNTGGPYQDGPYVPTAAPYPNIGMAYQDNYSYPNAQSSSFGGGYSDNRRDAEQPFAVNDFSDKNVFMILSVQLLVTAAFIAVFVFSSKVQKWVRRNSWFYYVSYAVFLCTYIALACCPSVRRRYPGNFIALGIFTLAFSYMTATISSFYNTQTVFIAIAITTVVCIGIAVFAIQTKIDFTTCNLLFFVLSMVLVVFGLFVIIFVSLGSFSNGTLKILHLVYAGLGALVFSLYLAYDIQSIIGGRKVELSPEEYVYGAMQLYLDVVQLFLFILQLVGSREN